LLNVALNGKTRIALDGTNAHILDDSGKDVKMQVARKIAKPQTIDQATGNQQLPTRAAPLMPYTRPSPERDTRTNPDAPPITIYLVSNPDGAEINVDDSFAGKAPMTLKLKPGQHAIRMFMNGYQNWAQWIIFQAGPDVHITATLEKSK
jgi:hypothetical protein